MSKEITLGEVKNSLENTVLKAASVKTIGMPVDVYNKELTNARIAGQNLIIAAVTDIIKTGGKHVEFSENSNKTLKDFIQLVKDNIK